jgi:hypothetical protein
VIEAICSESDKMLRLMKVFVDSRFLVEVSLHSRQEMFIVGLMRLDRSKIEDIRVILVSRMNIVLQLDKPRLRISQLGLSRHASMGWRIRMLGR